MSFELPLTEPGPHLDDWLAYIGSIHPVGWDLGLKRVAEVGRRLDVLHPSKVVILVAGTNGKGSTCEYLEQFALASGLRVGKSTSPHLQTFNERIMVDGSPVPDHEIVDAFQNINAVRGDITLTYFEFATLASLVIFHGKQLDVSILEIGLGGRLDAMNIVNPDLCIITAIALDHQDYLGDTRDEIAAEKAGIMREGVTCLIADREPPGRLTASAEQVGAPIYKIGDDFDLEPGTTPKLPADSFVVALEAAGRLNWDTTDAKRIADETQLSGRRSWGHLHCDVLLDVAHNPSAASSLADYLATLSGYQAVHAVIGMYADKDIETVTALLAPHIKTWHLCASEEPRAASAEDLKARLSADQSGNARTYDKIDEAFAGAASDAGGDDLILVFGSFPVVGTCLKLLPD
ncbi:MAG: bifunctional folylpolyglutamate synthase/dihydrofolate synthase [Pseudomonadales bacterium]|nr:bifunctional folylpolyglutamate synthase/dihydrofolate synthase [Pseudomonadales bacterium]MBO7007758.1 bifunctional folylpolyglutamate synthase/dihydrofolate synthase [Pseudomonadales bacterium]